MKKSPVKMCMNVNKKTVEKSLIKTMLSSKNFAAFAKKNKITKKKLMFVKKLPNDGRIIPSESVIKVSPDHKRWFSLQDKENKEKLLSISNLNEGKIEIEVFDTENCSSGDIDILKVLLKKLKFDIHFNHHNQSSVYLVNYLFYVTDDTEGSLCFSLM